MASVDLLELQAMKSAIEAARKCSSTEERKISPRVGAALIMNNEIVTIGHRGQLNAGEHAEFTVLEKLMPEVDVSGATLVTTLEPCTSRNEPKRPCVDRIIDRKIRTVIIGMLDPNPDIRGQGYWRLREAGIDVQIFPGELTAQLEELNKRFSAQYRPISRDETILVQTFADRSLDAWYIALNKIYWERNSHKDLSFVLAHLVEVVGGLSGLASEKQKPNVDPVRYIPKALGWWLALCGKAGVERVSDVIFRKFPRVCPYCEKCPHDDDLCRELKKEPDRPRWDRLADLASRKNGNTRPHKLSEWLIMFRTIFPVSQSETYGPTFARLTEELGELAEAVRVFEEEPNYFLSEAADVFAWLMRVENIRETKTGTQRSEIGRTLDQKMAVSYPDYCLDCDNTQCRCPPILKRTIGRIAKEMPAEPDGIFMTALERRALFGA